MVAPLPDSYRIDPLRESPATEDDILDLWASEGAVPGLAARRRLPHVFLLGTTTDGELAAITTIEPADQPRLRTTVFTARLYVGHAHRETALGSHMVIEMYERLARRYREGEDRTAHGLYGEVENELMKRYRNQAVWTEIGMAFIGEGEGGEHLRIAWFDGAPAPPPPPRDSLAGPPMGSILSESPAGL